MIDENLAKAAGELAAGVAIDRVRHHAAAVADATGAILSDADKELADQVAETDRWCAAAHAFGGLFTKVVLAMVNDVSPEYALQLLATARETIGSCAADAARKGAASH